MYAAVKHSCGMGAEWLGHPGLWRRFAGAPYLRHVFCLMLLLGILALPAYGTRAVNFDRDASFENAAIDGKDKFPARQVSATQNAAAKIAEGFGITTHWHPRLGTPLRVRGADLGRRPHFSGGKGVALKGGGAFEHDAVAVLDNLSNVYGIRDAAKEFRSKNLRKDSLGLHHVRLVQTHRGARVVGGELIVHFDKTGKAYEVSGQYIPDLDVDILPRLDADDAILLARQELLATGNAEGELTQGPELVVYARGATPRLAYEFALSHLNTGRGAGRWRYWVDAVDGSLLFRFNDLPTVSPPSGSGSSSTILGNVLTGEGGSFTSVTGWHEGNYYYLYNTGCWWYVYNVATHGYLDNSTYAYRYTTSNWGTTDRSEMSAAVNFNTVQDYYWQVHGRMSFDDMGEYARVNVHDSSMGANAQWDGLYFDFGDGASGEANPLTVLDVCGHEYTHAVTEHTSGLIYYGESGALNESFSDIMGACIEFHAQPDGRGSYPGKTAGASDWLVGEDAWISSTALRDMRSPGNAAAVGAGNEQPSKYHGTHWYSGSGDSGGVHYNSGVQNFFFYLLCEGGRGTNDGIEYDVTGIGVTNAERVAFRALTWYCGPNTDYPAVALAWESAALDLNTNWIVAVGGAWGAAGISDFAVSPATESVFGGPAGGPFSPAASVYTLTNSGASALDWTATHTQTWSDVTPSSGTLLPGDSAAVTVSINSAAATFGMGAYTDTVTFASSSPGSPRFTRRVRLRVAQRDYFTEVFDTTQNDIAYHTLTFRPNGSPSFYAAYCDSATQFPTDPTGGTSLSLADDSYASVALTGGAQVLFYGINHPSFFVGSNGYITFGEGDASNDESTSSHFNLPRITALLTDLNPTTPGSISWKQRSDRVAVTFTEVPEYGTVYPNSFQIEMFFDGTIRITYLALSYTHGVAGLSRGGGVPEDFAESDLTFYPPSPAPDPLGVTPDAAFLPSGNEGGPFSPAQTVYTLTNSGSTATDWTVSHAAAWLDVNPTEGTLDAGAATNVILRINAEARSLPPGLYFDQPAFTNRATGAAQVRNTYLWVKETGIYYFSLDSNPGWSTESSWAFGKPTGKGSNNKDPTSGHTGLYVYGYNLAGDYPNNMALADYLTTSALDFSAFETVTLRFWRWLGVEAGIYDHATIQVSTDGGTWSNVWTHTGATISETSWGEVSYALPSFVDRQPRVYIRWGMGPTDASLTYCGWNIDDITLEGRAVQAPKGTPIWWLKSNRLTNDTWEIEETKDADGDGMTTWQEWVAGTDPTNRLSVLMISDVSCDADFNPVVSWSSASNRTYTLSRTIDPGSSDFVPVATNLAATYPVNTYTDSVPAADRMFYRIDVQQ